MYYSFACPFPCNCTIKVNADDPDDAVRKIITAGAMSCRNLSNLYYCKKANLNLYPIPEDQLKNIVRSRMHTGD